MKTNSGTSFAAAICVGLCCILSTAPAPAAPEPSGFDREEMYSWKRLCDGLNWAGDFKALIKSDGKFGLYTDGLLNAAGYAFTLAETVMIAQEGDIVGATNKLSKWAAETGIQNASLWLGLTVKYGNMVVREGWAYFLKRRMINSLKSYEECRLARLGQIYSHNKYERLQMGVYQDPPERHELAAASWKAKIRYDDLRAADVVKWQGFAEEDWKIWVLEKGAERKGRFWKDPLETYAVNHYVRSKRIDKKDIDFDDPTALEDDVIWLRVQWEKKVLLDVLNNKAKAITARANKERERTDIVLKFRIGRIPAEEIKAVEYRRLDGSLAWIHGKSAVTRPKENSNLFYIESPWSQLAGVLGRELSGVLVVTTTRGDGPYTIPFDADEFMKSKPWGKTPNTGDRIKLICNIGTLSPPVPPRSKIKIKIETTPGESIRDAMVVPEVGWLFDEKGERLSSGTIELGNAVNEVTVFAEDIPSVLRVALAFVDEATGTSYDVVREVPVGVPPAPPLPPEDVLGVPLPPVADPPARDVEITIPAALEKAPLPERGEKVTMHSAAAAADKVVEGVMDGRMPTLQLSAVGSWSRMVPPPKNHVPPPVDTTTPPTDYEVFFEELLGVSPRRHQMQNPNAHAVLNRVGHRLYKVRTGEVGPVYEKLKNQKEAWEADVLELATEGLERFGKRYKPMFQGLGSFPSARSATASLARSGDTSSLWSIGRSLSPGVTMDIMVMYPQWRAEIEDRLQNLKRLRAYLEGEYATRCRSLLEERVDHARELSQHRRALKVVMHLDDADFDRQLVISENCKEIEFLRWVVEGLAGAVAVCDQWIGETALELKHMEGAHERYMADGEGLVAQLELARADLNDVRNSVIGLSMAWLDVQDIKGDVEAFQALGLPRVAGAPHEGWQQQLAKTVRDRRSAAGGAWLNDVDTESGFESLVSTLCEAIKMRVGGLYVMKATIIDEVRGALDAYGEVWSEVERSPATGGAGAPWVGLVGLVGTEMLMEQFEPRESHYGEVVYEKLESLDLPELLREHPMMAGDGLSKLRQAKVDAEARISAAINGLAPIGTNLATLPGKLNSARP